jgi:general secretion pathway protein G
LIAAKVACGDRGFNRVKRKFFIGIVSVIFVVLLAAIVIPSFLHPRFVYAQSSCINNLRQIDGAKLQWALEKGKTTNDIPAFEDIAPYMHLPIVCPKGGTYAAGKVGEPAKCSIGGEHVAPY